ncbi:MBOAT family O-acyltransferase [Teredinibacter purpureus]|uniref:MBOAT family O-acyltransferase n=1 Tax=Teredinibacter purpureus TaxID=2731756 RepID=UPI0019101F5B|nr:MBOAT family protein [Teredinibacter purpureus]
MSRKLQQYEGLASKLFLIIGVVFNLLIIAYFKYLFFFSEIAISLFSADFGVEKLILPVGISFYTFQQIAYLVDCYKDRNVNYNFSEYALFVTFFPQLIAGPIVHHKEIMPQISALNNKPYDINKLSAGAVMFIVGLSKKLVLADNLAKLADPVFKLSDAGASVDGLTAWMGALAYTFQLYFDFSAYSDMAVGLGLMFGLMLPINFMSPYKSASIVEFWRRWHITLSTFLRDYLYIALGGNRSGKFKRYRNLLLTMLLGGLWHGAGWNFIIWGGLHGVYLVVNHGFSQFCSRFGVMLPKVMGIAITMLCVVVAWVFFRAESTAGALTLLSSMFGFVAPTGPLASEFMWVPIDFILVFVAACIALFAPNIYQLFHYDGCKTPDNWQPAMLSFELKGSALLFPLFVGMLLCLSLMFMPQPTVFLYFNF